MDASQLPKEIIQHIFHYLEERFPYYHDDEEEDLVKGSLLQVQLTCKQWSQVARQVFYKKVDLSGNSEKVSLFCHTLNSANGVGHAVEELSFSDETFNGNISFSDIIKLCPNLKVLEQSQESGEDFYTQCLDLYHQGFLQRLQRVTPPTMLYAGNTLFRQYNSLMLAARKTISSLQLSQATQFVLADNLTSFINLQHISFESNKTITLHHLNSMLHGNHPFLKRINVDSAIPTLAQHLTNQNLSQNLRVMPQVKNLDLALCPLSLQDTQLIQHMFPQLENLFINRGSASYGIASHPLIRVEDHPEAVLNQLFNYLSAINHFYIGNVVVSTKELLIALTVIAKYFQVCHISIEVMEAQNMDQHNSVIATTEHFERIWVPRWGDKPKCGLGITLNQSQVDDLFCLELYKTIVHKTEPYGMVIIGRIAPQNQYLGRHLDYLLAHGSSLINLSLYDLVVDIPQIPNTAEPAFVLDFRITDCSLTPGTLQELARTMRLMDFLKMDNVQVLDAETNTSSHLMEINLPQTEMGTLFFYNSRENYSRNVFFKIHLGSNTYYYYIDLNGQVDELSQAAYLNRQNSANPPLPEFVVHLKGVYRVITYGGTIDII